VSAQENPWYKPVYIEGSLVHYYLPELFSGIMKPQPGFRAALGYEYMHFHLAVESGYTYMEGTNPLVTSVTLVPLTAEFGYHLPLRWGLGLQADISFGVFFSRTEYYSSAIDMLQGKLRDEQVTSPVAGARLYAVYVPFEWLKIYAGGGVDMVLETNGPIPPPVIEAGISIKPFALPRPKAKQQKPEPVETKPAETETPQAEEQLPVADIAAAKEPEKIVVFSTSVYFRADTTALIEEYRPLLDEAGRRLMTDKTLRVTLRGYAAPSGTEDGILALSAARSWYCAEYLTRCYGIAEERMSIEFYGARETQEEKAWELRRRVDLIIEQGAE
jgi:outer membrane protein OmpA-like peptidoglycan-associated protein